MPRISVVMPVYNGEKYLRESIDSVIEQTFTDWELLVINEFGSNDGTAPIVQEYAKKDSRIKLVQNEVKLGLADSLNRGIKLARGEYIARLDADDLAHPTRFEKQIKVMDENPKVGVCGTYQHHFGPNTDWIHKPPITSAQCRAGLLFNCDICHSTLMLRKKTFLDNDLFYDRNKLAEDFELWSRAVAVTDFVNIPEVLGEYRWGDDNITVSKLERLNIESGHIVCASLKRNLNFDIEDSDSIYFRNWENPFDMAKNQLEREKMFHKFEKILKEIYDANKKIIFYNEQCLLNLLAAKWRWAKYHEPWNNPQNVSSIDEIFDENYKPSFSVRWKHFLEQNPTFKSKVKKILKKVRHFIFSPVRRPVESRLAKLEENICNCIESKTWDRYQRIEKLIEEKTEYLKLENEKYVDQCFSELTQTVDEQLQKSEQNILQTMDGRIWKEEQNILQTLDGRIWKAEQNISERENVQNAILEKLDISDTEQNYIKNLIPFKTKEKIRIVFFFQVASFWPSWESFYKYCLHDDRFEVTMVLLNDVIVEKVQMQTAKEFLIGKGISFIEMEEFNLRSFNPHIVVYQTPFDSLHRAYAHWSGSIKAEGVRIVYIPYGLEISDTAKARNDQLNCDVLKNAWRVYTFSDKMLEDYKKYSSNSGAVKALGHPKFDGLYNKEQYVLPQNVLSRINGRKICLWKVHFPNRIKADGKDVMITPSLEEYVQFAKQIENYSDLFFIFMPHPKFMEACQWVDGFEEQGNKLFSLMQQQENVYIDLDDDYRPALANADYIIIDRSAVMVEAGAMDVPVLYMQNQEFQEPSTKAIEPLIQSYYHGFRSEDMIQFLESCKNGIDPEKGNREKAFHQCIPYFDGCCGKRIAEDIVQEMEKIQNELD